MKRSSRLSLTLATLFTIGLAVVGTFQACGAFPVSSDNVTSILSIDHPNPDPKVLTGQTVVVAGKTYVAELMRDIFTATTVPATIGTYALGALSLDQGQSVRIGAFLLAMQTDGNAVLYDGNGTAVWYTSTNGGCTACRLVFQSDGNLVVYNTATSVALYNTGTFGTGRELQFYASSPFLGIVNASKAIIFPTTYSSVSGLNALIEQWITFRPSQYGGSCNPYDTYAGADCGGDVSNASLPSLTAHSSLRESYRLQFCQIVLADDMAVSAALEKIAIKPNVMPTQNSIAQAYALFYRDQEPDGASLQTLMDLDGAMTNANEPPLERWRAILLQVCESPAWQLL